MVKIKNKTIFTGKIKLLSGLHIGSGKMSLETDATVMKDAFDKPYIPGSSLKGVLRAVSERLHHLVLTNNSVPVCFLAENDCNQGEASKELQEKLQPLIRDGKENEVNNEIDQNICPICQLYGSTFRASKIVVHDGTLTKNNDSKIHSTVRHSVKIDRDTGAAKDGAKFDYEVVHAGEEFDFMIEGENLSTQDEKLLYLAIHELVNGNIQLGGKISRGLGSVQLVDAKVKTYHFDHSDDKKAYLKSLINKKHEGAIKVDDNKFNIIFELV
ncbi:CRISPR-associated RAMP protein [Lottiidibacillus patelloidae]|uniref:CRISPR-associated RAMP protein n=1 Tax=Lottiidibacillus patelloidae TaxID=2670334 RepID=A0A263BRC4_9BACI|nr:CRISPR-associated RAMP protein Csx7 [Lottiidibacillus patelloidae]OZM56250.1 CRISPR-associated RAMP protein [Lottiidibacillus patelloidae]